jgi:cation diffusion facilitator family transporter
MSKSGGRKAVVAALGANVAIAVSKFVAWLFTGSSSMLAESMHSLADSANQGLLLFGARQAQRRPDEEHPFGYGRDRYFYAFVVALVLFSLGSVFALYEGYHKLHTRDHLESPYLALGVLGVAAVLEGLSFRTALRESNAQRGSLGWVAFVRRSKSPELPVVLLEDLGALVGLGFAIVGVALTIVTGDSRCDAVATLCIGALLGVIAVVLILETKSLLIGEGATAEQVDAVRAALLASPDVPRVIHLKTLHLGPEELLVAAKIAVDPSRAMPEVAAIIDAAEQRVRAAVPIARVVFLEPDLYRPDP